MSTAAREIFAPEAKQLIESNRGNSSFMIIDVRTPAELALGRIPGSVNIDIHSGSFMKNIKNLDKSALYLVYCRTGHRSREAARILSSLGFSRVCNLNDKLWNLIDMPEY